MNQWDESYTCYKSVGELEPLVWKEAGYEGTVTQFQAAADVGVHPCSLLGGLRTPFVALGSDAASKCGAAICVLVTLDSYRLALWSGGWLLPQ